MRPDQLDEEYKQGTLTSLENANEVDTSWSTVALSSSTSTNDDEMLGTQGVGSAASARVLRTPLLSKDAVNSVILRISETHEAADVSCYTGNLPQDDAGYDPLHPPPLCDPWASGYPQLQVALNGVNSSMCYIDLDTTPAQTSGVLPIGVVYKDYKLTNGCPGAVDANSTFPSNLTSNKWDPTKINSVVYNVYYKRSKWLQANQNPNVEPGKSAKTFRPKPSAGLNGLELQVGYTGPPAPQYPGGCNAAAGRDKGVQFIFGNLSRMAFLEHDSWVELCGLARDAEKHSIALWGLGGPQCNDATLHTPCQTTTTDTPDPLQASSTGQSHKVDSATRLITDYDVVSNVTTSGVTGFTNAGTAAALTADDSNFAYTNAAWTGSTHNTFSVKLPSNFIPNNSVIEHVRLKLQHAEPKITSADSAVTNITLSVTPGSVAPDTSDTSSDNTASTFGAHAVPPRLTSHTYDSTAAATPATDYAAKCTALPLDCWRTYDSDSEPLTAADLTVAMRNSKGLNSAVITLDAFANDAAATKHQMFVNGLEMIVDYRPPGVLRPLSGCMTIRTVTNRYTQSGTTPGDGAPSTYRGTAYDHNGAFGGGNYLQTNNDKAAQTNQGIANSNSCSWIAFGSHSSNDQQGAKLHIAGDVFGPTVSLDLAGKSNETSFVTDGVVARQITARRWVSTSQLSAFGNNPTFTHNPRIMYLTASIGGVDIATAEVHIDDAASTTTISSWKRLS